jgi:hypothetical protein
MPERSEKHLKQWKVRLVGYNIAINTIKGTNDFRLYSMSFITNF